MEVNYNKQIASELSLRERQVSNTIELLNDGATIPFIARYRKEMTQSLDEVQIANIRDRLDQLIELDKRRKSILDSIEEQGKLTDDLKQRIEAAQKLSELEDLYLPYKRKRKTKASIAREKGLEPLADLLIKQDNFDVDLKAESFIDAEKQVESSEEALAGARDIVAEWVNENEDARKAIRKHFGKKASIQSKVVKTKIQEAAKFQNYFEWEESLMNAPSHRVLAMFRGENEGFLKLKIAPSETEALELLDNVFIKRDNEAAAHVQDAISDSYKRLLLPSIKVGIPNSAVTNSFKSSLSLSF